MSSSISAPSIPVLRSGPADVLRDGERAFRIEAMEKHPVAKIQATVCFFFYSILFYSIL